ncbi:MAG: hypothetical protein R3292_07145 [Alcanivorax sp.]|nr:hypothetical protein [Alcanivorax sp.]
MRRIIRFLFLLVLLLVVAVPVAGIWINSNLHDPLPLKQARLVQVTPGMGFNRFLFRLREQGLLGDAREAHVRYWGARVYSLFTGVAGRMHVGEYQLQPGDSLQTLLDKIEKGQVL